MNSNNANMTHEP